MQLATCRLLPWSNATRTQTVADAFAVSAGLDETFFEPGDDLRPQSMQPVIYLNEDGERKIEMMRWAFKLPDRLLFNARSEGIERSKFWADAFLKGRVIVPEDVIYEWQEVEKGKKKPKYEFVVRGHKPFGMASLEALEKPEDRSVGTNLCDSHRRTERTDGADPTTA
jgi:putative SOS response-associated peptidase YedK